jgi:hypothetical protein
MDRGELSEAIIQELGEVFKAELRLAGPALLTADLDGLEHRLQQVSRRACGVTIARVAAVRAAVVGERPPCPTCGGVLRLVERAGESIRLSGITSGVTWRRACRLSRRGVARRAAAGRADGRARIAAGQPADSRGVAARGRRGPRANAMPPHGPPSARSGQIVGVRPSSATLAGVLVSPQG